MGGSTVRVKGFPRETTTVDLQHFFEDCGKVIKVHFIHARIANVLFDTYEGAEKAVQELNGNILLGKRVTIDNPRLQNSKRFGVIVKNLSSDVTWKVLKAHMRKAGRVTYCDTKKSHFNEGLVYFASYSDMRSAIKVLDGTDLNGVRIRLEEDVGSDGSSLSSSRSTSVSLSGSRSSSRSSIDHVPGYPCHSGANSCSDPSSISPSGSLRLQNRSRSSFRSDSSSSVSSNGSRSAQSRSRPRSRSGRARILGQLSQALCKSKAEYDCPSCFSSMSLPIYPCTEAHCYCSECPYYIRKCEVCRGMVPSSCVMSLQQAQSFEIRPCRYSDQGCDYIGSGMELASHHVICKITTMECPLKFMKCRWLGKLPIMPQHCAENHPNNFHFVPEKRFLISNFVELRDRRFDMIFNVYDTFFRCAWELSKKTGIMRIAVYHVGSPFMAMNNQFTFRVIFHSEHLSENFRDDTSLGGHIFQMYNYNERFVEEKYVELDHKHIVGFCQSDGSLHYTISILDE